MNAAEIFRLSVTERLEAVAKEFFLLFHRSVAQYEEEIERQRRLLDVAWKPYIKLHRIGKYGGTHTATWWLCVQLKLHGCD